MRWLTRVIAMLIAVALVAPVSTPAAASRSATTVSEQVAWLVEASDRPPVTEDEAWAHLSPRYLDRVGLAGFNALLARVGPVRLQSLRTQALRADTHAFGLLTGAGQRWHLVAIAEPGGRLDYLSLVAVPATWAEVDRRVRALAPRTSLLAAEVDAAGRCRPVHALDAGTARPIGSAFKLYVLGALAQAVRAGTASWDEPLAVRDEWKADPGGAVGPLPAGTVLPLREYAAHMMFYSDNSATDHLIHRLGRRAVEAQQYRFGMRNPRANQPFLLARELFQLKAIDYPTHAAAYTALDTAGRRSYLRTVVEQLPLPTAIWSQPRDLDTIEWFASPLDVCRAFAGLRGQRQAPAADAMSLQGTTELGLATVDWPTGWSKGGSEPGVLTRNYLARTAGGRTLVVSLMLSDSQGGVNTSDRVAEILAIYTGAFQLADRHRR